MVAKDGNLKMEQWVKWREGVETSWKTSNSKKKRNEMKGYIVTDDMEVERREER
jgi:hypothetical protein